MLIGQLMFVYIFVIFKQSDDMFKKFNKRPDIAFSIYQSANKDNQLRQESLNAGREKLKKALLEIEEEEYKEEQRKSF